MGKSPNPIIASGRELHPGVRPCSLFFTARDTDPVAISDLFFPLASNLHVWIDLSAEVIGRRRTDDTQVSEKYGTSPSGLEWKYIKSIQDKSLLHSCMPSPIPIPNSRSNTRGR